MSEKAFEHVVEVDGKKYRYHNSIHSEDELDYLQTRFHGLKKLDKVKSLLIEEYKPV